MKPIKAWALVGRSVNGGPVVAGNGDEFQVCAFAERDAIVAYKRRRFIPTVEGQTTLLEHSVTQGERLDNITARYLGDPTQFWRVCDANLVLCPEELEEVGRRITIALPQP